MKPFKYLHYSKMDSHLPIRNQEISLPHTYWSVLSSEDKTEFMRLRANFLQGQKMSSKDRRIVTFRKELIAVLKYIERSEDHTEERSVLVGVCFAGPFICVNTRQLKNFLGRCKSSINGSFQQMGYVALRTKAKARSCVVAVMPTLQNEQNILRQWTVRCASEDAHFCFISSFSHVQLPQITEDDLYDEKRTSNNPLTPINQQIRNPRPYPFTNPPPIPPISSPPPIKPRQLPYDLPSIDDNNFENDFERISDLTSSYSVDNLAPYNDNWENSPIAFENINYDWDSNINNNSKSMTRSMSSFLPQVKEWGEDLMDF